MKVKIFTFSLTFLLLILHSNIKCILYFHGLETCRMIRCYKTCQKWNKTLHFSNKLLGFFPVTSKIPILFTIQKIFTATRHETRNKKYVYLYISEVNKMFTCMHVTLLKNPHNRKNRIQESCATFILVETARVKAVYLKQNSAYQLSVNLVEFGHGRMLLECFSGFIHLCFKPLDSL